MLVLTRKVDQVIVIAGVVTLKVLKAENGRVSLGFEAPDWVKILRGELSERPKVETD